jgi:hypothetical protein
MSTDVLDRVRKLLALSGSPNVHEAAAAARRAQALIAEHRLEQWLAAETEVAEDPDPITMGSDAPLEEGRRIRQWKLALASTLARHNGCVAWLRQGKPQGICVVGRQRDRELVSVMWTALVRRVEWLSATEGAGRHRHWHEAFRIGVVDAIGEQLRAGDESQQPGSHATAMARVEPLQVAHREALDSFVAAHFAPGRGRGLRVDAGAYDAGHAASGALTPHLDS